MINQDAMNRAPTMGEIMRGEIMVDSRPEEGTTFTFTLPYSIP